MEIEIKEEPRDPDDETYEFDLDKLGYEEKLKFVTPISQPLAPKKLYKKILKLIKKAKATTTKQGGGLRFGLKDVQRRIRHGEKGLVILAGDVTPVDVIIHFPVLCEDNNLPYCYVPTRSDIGTALGVASRGPIVVLINQKQEYQELYDLVWEKIKLLPVPL